MATQADRSAATCDKLMNATVAALVARGYRGASTPDICKRAGVSRGAQLHHYPTKESLVAAAVDHVLTQRVAELSERLSRPPKGVVDLEDATAFLWTAYASDAFYAWLELVVAARTDPELRKQVAEIDARFIARAERMVSKFLLPYVSDPKEVAATTRLILAVFDGLALHRSLHDDDSVARHALRTAGRKGLFTPKGRDA